jgi:cysteine desulfurase
MTDKTSVYLDYAAATPLDRRVLEVMTPHMTERFANPSSMHALGRRQRQALEAARARVAGPLGARPTEIIFTSGSTEAANLAIHGVMAAWPHGQAVVSAVEHESVLQTVERAASRFCVVNPGPQGLVKVEDMLAAITDDTVLVCLQYVNNETGVIQPVAKLAAAMRIVRQQRSDRGNTTPLYLYSDAAQAGLLSLQVSRLGVDLMSMGGSKLYGPTGIGFLYVRSGTHLRSQIGGGGQERGLRSGTEPVAGAVGLAEALELIQGDRVKEAERLTALRNRLWTEIQQTLAGATLNGDLKHQAPGYLNISIPGVSGEELVARLDAAGFAVATGSACTAAHEDPSHVLLAMGKSPTQAGSSLRLSLGRSTTSGNLKSFIQALNEVVQRLRKLS